MKATELIKQLKKAVKKHGDHEVGREDNESGHEPIDQVEFVAEPFRDGSYISDHDRLGPHFFSIG